jgi:lysophospholipase L1-like esterase
LSAASVLSGFAISHTPIQRRDRQRKFEAEDRDRELRKPGVIEHLHTRHRVPLLEANEKLNSLAKQLHASVVPIENPCISDSCPRMALDRLFERFDKLDETKTEVIRVLHLGDSHVAADYITGTIRKILQHRFGDAGRGFVAVDQRAEYGGRRLSRTGWKRARIVDPGRSQNAFGFSGMSDESRQPGARLEFKLEPQDAAVTLFYHAQRNGARLRVMVDDTVIGELDTRARDEQSLTRTFQIPAQLTQGNRNRPHQLALVASDAGVKVFGLSFETRQPGAFYDTVGPVGADARVYLSLDRRSFQAQLAALKPDLVVLMVGGNDALMMRKGQRTLEDVRTDHERIIEVLHAAVPEADCMIWSPMDAGEMVDGHIASKRFISEVRNMQRAAATKHGCAFWDMFDAMGGNGAFARWHRAGIMNDDLVHPQATAGELLGNLFATALMEAYLAD